MKRDRSVEELRALVLANNPQLNAAELDALTDLQVLERVRNSIIVDDRPGQIRDLELEQVLAFLDYP
ncbi:hypothetical protein HMH05_20075 [Pseudomonas sp. SbB1]|uniref:hypothetical protein n=1 Tax=Pseudomonas TaxID=286 RepID=UPI00059B1733|nr:MULTISPECIES: hypothetical protein [Pseudomonas]MBP0707693.1 hypothetical protein [Pseudomonas sp. T34]MCK2187132.1 hypothetical protein [Pseudomonas sp. MB04B]MDD2085617.1 hypothetical protein [Pseudomonas putida]MDD2095896.1 hypothetical protein [Pseudomonas putida]NOG90085.1 hypothetical protein [Pseudomonas sp. SbB1]